MTEDTVFRMPDWLAADTINAVLENLATWSMKTAEQYRNAVLSPTGQQIGVGFAINPLLNIEERRDAMELFKMLRMTVEVGRMIDFGFIPNEIIKSESKRSRIAFEAGEFTHPYDAYLAVTQWEGGCNGYHVSLPQHHPDKILILETYGVNIPGLGPLIIVYDIISIRMGGIDNCDVFPFPVKDYIPYDVVDLKERGANSLDPLVTMLSMLHDATIPITRFDAPVKLNKQRAALGKPRIPEHTIVGTRDYVTQYKARQSGQHKGPHQGGTHASPIAHSRRAHKRRLDDGRVIPVASSKVNWRDTEELHRMFYKLH